MIAKQFDRLYLIYSGLLTQLQTVLEKLAEERTQMFSLSNVPVSYKVALSLDLDTGYNMVATVISQKQLNKSNVYKALFNIRFTMSYLELIRNLIEAVRSGRAVYGELDSDN